MSIGRWEVRDKELWLIDRAGKARIPTANEIYSALVEKRPAEEWMPASVDGLRTSRYP